MSEITLNIEELKQSASNVRAKHDKDDIEMMARSIERRGIINPPAVAKNGDGKYEIIAGFLRVLGARKAGVEQVRCLDVTALTPAERVEISLSENIDRRSMTAIQYYTAFNQLFKAGMPVSQIAARFDKTEREVQQLLAIGSLPKKILALAEIGDIGDRTLKALAIASGKDVTRYAKLSAKERPNDWDIHNWLAGQDGMFRAKNALFDLEEYQGGKIVDLFAEEDEEWLTDGAEFMRLQDKAVTEAIADYERKGWQVERVDYFQKWAYDKTAKAKGGKVFWTRDDRTQAVEFHVGYARQKQAGTTPKAKDGKKQTKPEISNAFENYMTEIRHAAVQRHMLDDKKAGLIGTLVLLLKECDNIQFRSGGMALSDEYQASVQGCDNKHVVESDYDEMLNDLGIGTDTWEIKIPELVKTLSNLGAPTLQRMIVTTVAYKWACQGKASTTLGKALGLKTVNIWEPDDTFWNGIKNKQTLIKIAKVNKIPIDENATTKVIRSIVQEKRPDTWRPEWLSFKE